MFKDNVSCNKASESFKKADSCLPRWLETKSYLGRRKESSKFWNITRFQTLSGLVQIIQSEWSLHTEVFSGLHKRFPPMEIDLFATAIGHGHKSQAAELLQSWSRCQVFNCRGLSISWKATRVCLSSQWELIPEIQQMQGFVLLIAPAWTNQAWCSCSPRAAGRRPSTPPSMEEVAEQEGGGQNVPFRTTSVAVTRVAAVKESLK